MNRRIGIWLSACMFFLMAAAPAHAADDDALSNFAAANVVIGQKKFNGSGCNRKPEGGKPGKNTICGPEGAGAAGGTTFFLPDSGNVRVLGFKGVPKKNGASAKFVLGQTKFTKENFGVSGTLFEFPSAVVTAGSQLLMTDFSNSRVLIWNKLPTKTNTPADLVVGQSNLTSNTSAATQSGLNHPEIGLFVADGKLFVSDRNNNRVLIWNSIPTANGAPADVVIGQPDFTSSDGHTTQTGLDEPEGLWSDGTQLVVADEANNRVLIWNTIPTTNGAPADVVIGQPDFTSSGAHTTQTGLDEPEGLWSDGTQLVVADEANSRVLIWNTIPTTNGAPADLVVGQPDFTSSDIPEPPNEQSLNQPGGVASDGSSLYVEDSSNNRILVYSPFPTSNNPEASVVLGQADFTHSDRNAGNASASAQTLDFPFGLSIIGTQLIVNDFGNNRYLIFNL